MKTAYNLIIITKT